MLTGQPSILSGAFLHVSATILGPASRQSPRSEQRACAAGRQLISFSPRRTDSCRSLLVVRLDNFVTTQRSLALDSYCFGIARWIQRYRV